MSLTEQIHEIPTDQGEGSSHRAPKEDGLLKRIANLELTPKKVPRKDLMHFSRQMAVFMHAGIPVIDALETIALETTNKLFKKILDEMAEDLRTGLTFADAAAKHGTSFPEYYVGMLRSAELTGNLDEVLDRLADYIDRDLEARRKVTSALTYPAIIGVVAIVVIGILVGYVLPKFTKFFKDLDAKLPLATRMLIGISNFFSHQWYIPAGIALILFVTFVVLQGTPGGRITRDKMVLRLPLLGDLVRTALLERFCRILSSMLSAGVTLPQAMTVAGTAMNNAVFRVGLADAREAMLRGEGLSEPLAATGLFPPAARQMMRVGENTGTLDKQLDTAATYFDRELDHRIKRFSALFEPLVIVFMGVCVGFVAIALVSAMYGIFNQVKT